MCEVWPVVRRSTTQVENGVRQETPKKDDKKSKDEQEATEFACDVEEGTGQCPSAHNKQIHSPFGHMEGRRGVIGEKVAEKRSYRQQVKQSCAPQVEGRREDCGAEG